MKFTSFLRLFGGHGRRTTPKRRRSGRLLKARPHLAVEQLELRLVPTVISINDVSTLGGNSGTHNALFTVSLDARPAVPVSFNFATANGSGTAGSDYQGSSGTLTIPAGQLSTTIPIAILGNTIDQLDRTFFVNLSNPTNAS